jgi:hypothetical protein
MPCPAHDGLSDVTDSHAAIFHLRLHRPLDDEAAAAGGAAPAPAENRFEGTGLDGFRAFRIKTSFAWALE